MATQDRALAERVHVTVTAAAPELSPNTWYGMAAYTNSDGKIVVFFQDADKFSYRYSTPAGCQKCAWALSCGDARRAAVGHDDRPCPFACST
ncbi:MAG TPA: hypothetical protein VIJ82_03225 [Streptosporangiaceae bacterium]